MTLLRSLVISIFYFSLSIPLVFSQNGSILEKRINLDYSNIPVSDLIDTISKQTGVVINYSNDLIPDRKRTCIQVKNLSLGEVLTTILEGTGLVYTEYRNQVLLSSSANKDEKKKATGRATLSGFIKEKGSGELLIGAAVYIPELKTGTVTNAYGFYSLTLPSDTFDIIISSMGYISKTERILLDRDIELKVDMDPALAMLQEVKIEGSRQEKISESSQMSAAEIPIGQIKDIPALMGEKDVIKVLQLIPGVQKGNEGNNGLYIRGGGQDQNLVILDNAPLYNPAHLWGFLSLFNGDALKSIELIKEGFPARFGGRLSSVLEMNMREGNKEKIAGELGISIISSKLSIEGPVKKNRSSFLISARRTYLDLLLKPFADYLPRLDYYFYDLNAKVNYDFGSKNKVYLSSYRGRDKDFFQEKLNGNSYINGGLAWGNTTTTARWNHLFNNRLFANASFIFSDYKYGNKYKENISGKAFTLDNKSGIRDYTIKYDLEYFPLPRHHIRAGFVSIYHRFTPSAVVLNDASSGIYKKEIKLIEAVESAVYAEDDLGITSRLRTNIGLRYSHFATRNKYYYFPEPRFSGAYMLMENLSLKASFAIMNQCIHLLSNTGVGVPTALWVPSTRDVAPQNSKQFALGIAKDFLQKNFFLSLEGYYKRSKRIIGYKEGASFFLIDPYGSEEVKWEDNITTGKGWSYGSELFIQKKTGRLTGWIGYTLSWTLQQFDSLNFGKKFYADYDRRNDISFVAIYQLRKEKEGKNGITLSATWVYGAGNAITLPLAGYVVPQNNPGNGNSLPFSLSSLSFVNEYGSKNDFRMAPYHRLDAGIQIHKKLKRNWIRTVEISCYNVYNRKNPYFYFVGIDSKSGNRVLKQKSLFPIIPSVSWSLKF